MKKKSIKLIGIILLIVIILTISIILLCKNINNKKQNEYNKIINGYLDSVKLWKENNNIGNAIITKVTLGDLINDGYIKENVKNPLTKEYFDTNITFCIINDNGEYLYIYDDGFNCGETNLTYKNTPNEIYNGYLYTQVINIDFSNLEGLEYYIKTTRDGESNSNISFSCGKKERPIECKNIKSTKNIKANIWYKVAGDLEITFDETNNEEGIIYAMTTDNVSFENIISGTISKIDRVKPVVVLDTPVTSTNSISVKIKKMIDNETSIASSVCRYGTEQGKYTTISMSNTRGELSKCSVNYILKDKIYYYEVCATDVVGNVGCAEGSSLIQSVKSPIITYLDDGVSISFNNKKNKNYTYYIKSSKKGQIEENTIAYCDKTVMPSNCINNKVTTIMPNIWYQVSGDLKINYEDGEGYLYALILNSEEYGSSVMVTLK